MSSESLSLLVIAGRQFSSPYSQWAERAAPVRSWPTPHTLWSWESIGFKDLFSNLFLKSSQVRRTPGDWSKTSGFREVHQNREDEKNSSESFETAVFSESVNIQDKKTKKRIIPG